MPVAVIRYQYDNHLGSASLELDATAQIISYEEYHPFGTTSYRSGKSETEVSQKRYKYVGKERDEETGLYYYGFRYYAPWIARFINVDPLQHEYPHYTPFQYAGNKPITYVDLDGLEPAEKIVPVIMEVVWKQSVNGNTIHSLRTVLGRTSIWIAAFELFSTTKSSSQSLAKDYYQKSIDTGKEEWFWEYWQGPGYNYPKPPMSSAQELEEWKKKYWSEDVPLNIPNADLCSDNIEKSEDDNENDIFIYRGGSFTYKNLTPRPGKDDIPGRKSGLSAWLTHEQATFGKGGKSQKLSVSKLKKLGFVVDISPDGHVGIKPPTQEKLKEWAESRDNLEKGLNPHILTFFLALSRVGEINTPKIE